MKDKGKFNGPARGRTSGARLDDMVSDRVTGVLSVARSGTGFVAADDGGEDIMIPSGDVGQAFPGDKVSVRLSQQPRGEKRRAGRILEVLERGTGDIVCTLRRTGEYLAAVPMIPNFKHTFHVEDTKGAKEGDRVIVRFTSWDNPMLNPDAEITAVIGPADNPSFDTESIIKMYDLPGDFPPGVEREAETVSVRLKQPGSREDLRSKFIITIDPATAKDFDDALSFETDAEGHRVLGVHIADVSHFVRVGSPIDAEARKRGTSVYLVDKVIPMLPEQLSNGVCSLVPDEDRLAFSAFITFNAAGTMVSRKFMHSIIRSKRRLTYEQAQEVIDANGGAEQVCNAECRALIMQLHELSQQLRANRFKRFALDISSPEMQVELDANGMMVGIHPAVHSVSHELVEEAMVAANEAVAAEVSSRRIPYISRYHEAPSEEKIADLSASVAALGLDPGDLMNTGNLARLLKAVHGTPLQYYVSMQVLKSMKRAEYAVDHEGHFGLAKRFYSHFTSPIRRYPDLVIHRQLSALITGEKSGQPSREELAVIAATSTATEFRAEQASRDLIEMKKYRFLAKQIADGQPLEYDAVIVKVMEFGTFVEIPEVQIGGLIHISQISEKFVRYDSFRERLTAPGISLGAGDKLRVLVSSVNFDERKVDFTVVGVGESRGTAVPREMSSKATRHRERRERRGIETPPSKVHAAQPQGAAHRAQGAPHAAQPQGVGRRAQGAPHAAHGKSHAAQPQGAARRVEAQGAGSAGALPQAPHGKAHAAQAHKAASSGTDAPKAPRKDGFGAPSQRKGADNNYFSKSGAKGGEKKKSSGRAR